MENVSSSNGLEKYPKLRFPGFDEPYRVVTLGEISSMIKRSDPQSNAPVMMLSAGNGFIMQSDKYSRDNAGQSLKKYILLKKGELAYNHGASKAKQFGCCYELQEEEARIPYVYHCFKVCDTEYTPYVALELNNPKMDKQLKRLVSSSVRMDGLLNISYEEYMSVQVYLPAYSEQKRIADFIEKLDERIAKQEQLIEALKKYKRGVITYIFSGKCNKFAAEATWTEKTLADLCCEFRSGRNISASLITETGEYAVYGGNGIRGYCDHYSHEGEYVVVGRQGALCGNVRLIQGKNYLSEHAIAVQANDENDTKFLLFLLYFMKLGQYSDQGAQPGLAVNKLLKLKCTVPDKEIQSKIASFLLNIDLQISNHEKMLSFLVDQRKAFLQQLFI
ncbi:restriction endonuclease subunit S [Flavonifractor plautii]|uniref:restriction endonuclease subunit S n=1 Tax=Flavonifractor plautii TaxID=292800 RepID=UPI001FA96699|nr:restriction endonuclease subunit S [Flavonifractor plautii]